MTVRKANAILKTCWMISQERGKLINLIQLFIGNEKLIDKIQPEIIKFFEQSRTIDILSVMLVESSVYFKVS
ncbi:hypothetical protein [Peribacillus frigoritolerans]|uniref:hypothetical protein n=1 Tax=Peribacillus frigoritolerans TaxID=450367 RepID=UPI003F81587C